MDCANLAIVFASNIIKPEEETMEATLKFNHVNNLVKLMIEQVNELEEILPMLKEGEKDRHEDHDWPQDLIRYTKQTPIYVDKDSIPSEDELLPPPTYIPIPPSVVHYRTSTELPSSSVGMQLPSLDLPSTNKDPSPPANTFSESKAMSEPVISSTLAGVSPKSPNKRLWNKKGEKETLTKTNE